MENKPLLHSIRELTEIIGNCRSPHAMQIVILNLEDNFESYSISDRGFLLAMIGMTIMRISDEWQPKDDDVWKVNALLLSRTDCAKERESNDLRKNVAGDYEDLCLFV